MTTTAPTVFAFDADKVSTLFATLTAAADAAVERPDAWDEYLRTLPEALAQHGDALADLLDPVTFDPVWADRDDTGLLTLLDAAWEGGLITGPARPYLIADDDSYCHEVALGEDPARVKIVTPWEEWRHIVGREPGSVEGRHLRGAPAAVSYLDGMVSDLNAALAGLRAFVAASAA